MYYKNIFPQSDDRFCNWYLLYLVAFCNLASFIVGIILFLVLSIPLLLYIGLRIPYDGLKKIGCNTGKNRNI